MSEVLIIHNQIQQTSTNSPVQSHLADQFVENLRVGQNLKAQLVIIENRYWLVTENYRIAIPKETVEQWNLINNQAVKLKVTSLANPLALQLVNNKLPNSQSPDIAKPLAEQKPLADLKQLVHLKSLINLTASTPLMQEAKNFLNIPSVANQVANQVGNQLVSPQNIQTKSETLVNDKPASSTLDANSKLVTENKEKKLSQLIQTLITRSESSQAKSSDTKSISDRLPAADKSQITASTEGSKPKSTRLIAQQAVASGVTKLVANSKDATSEVAKPVMSSKLASVITKPESSSKSSIVNTSKVAVQVIPIATPAKPIKFEIAVSLPDGERFPVLAEKITTAYNRQFEVQKPINKSINNLLLQLQRLNQWSVDNKATRRTEGGTQVEKLASSLKESLRDMFRYISPKESLKTARSVEKAIQHSGSFLEKKIAKQDMSKNDVLSKSSSGLTIHKDLKANLNRILATALYNLAKLNTATSTTAVAKSPTTLTQAEQKSLNAQKQLTNSPSLLKTNLLNNIRSSLIRLSSGKSSQINMAELESITKQVLKDTQSALARTQLSQLTNLRPEAAPQQWLFELPVLNDNKLDIFNLYMKQHAEEEDVDSQSNKPGWSIVLQFDIGALGKIRAMLSWADNAVQVKFIAEQEDTASLVDEELNYFQNKLADKDISFEQLTVEQAKLDELSFQFSKGSSND